MERRSYSPPTLKYPQVLKSAKSNPLFLFFGLALASAIRKKEEFEADYSEPRSYTKKL